MKKAEIYAVGVCFASVCADKDASIDEVEDAVNLAHPTGIASRWKKHDGPFKTGEANPFPREVPVSTLWESTPQGGSVLKLSTCTVLVHRHMDEPGAWFLTCWEINVAADHRIRLGGSKLELEDAQKRALELLERRAQDMADEIGKHLDLKQAAKEAKK